MADIFFKPSHEDLADERKKALKGTTEEEWCNRCVNTLVRILRKDPVAYRQYGALLVEPEKIRDKQTA